MPIKNEGWELHIIRSEEQRRANGKQRVRTVGSYQVYHDGVEQKGKLLSGMVAEAKGPGANRPEGNGKRITEGRYPLSTHLGAKSRYVTIGFKADAKHAGNKIPSLRLTKTDQRTGILLHPGVDFLSSIGCINPCTSLPKAGEMIAWDGSLKRTIAIIEDLKTFVGDDFPASNNRTIPRAHIVIDGEPAKA